MALPPGLTPKTVTVGVASFFDGSIAGGRVTITAPVNVVHTPSNRPIFSSDMTKPFVDGEASFDLCPTDAAGLNRVDWTYKLKVEVSGAKQQPEVIYFTLPEAGPDTVDLDALVTVPSSAGTPVSVAVLTAEDLDGYAAQYVADPESETRQALDALELGGGLDDAGVAALAADSTSATGTALRAASVAAGREEFVAATVLSGAGIDPTGVSDSTVAMQDKLTAAGPGGSVFLPKGTYRITAPLIIPAGCEVHGAGIKASVLRATTDIVALTGTGEGIAVRDLKVLNTVAGRTTYDLDFPDPTKLTIERVEITLPGNNTGKGGLHLHRNGTPYDTFASCCVYLRDVFIRNGTLKVTDVSDSKVHGGWTWATNTGAPGAVDLDRASNWTIVDHDVVPSENAGYLISGQLSKLSIIGGMIDGSYADKRTGWGIKSTAPIRALSCMGVKFWNVWQGGIWLADARRCTIVGNIFSELNRGDIGVPDIRLEAAVANVISGNTFAAPFPRTNKGKVLTEDSNCRDNIFTGNVVETNSTIVPNGHYYDPAMISDVASTLVKDNRPEASWPQGAVGEAVILTRLSALAVLGATAWPVANTAVFQRFSIPVAGEFRYVNMQVDVSSGNYHVGVVKLSGGGLTNYTRLMHTGIVATPAARSSGLRIDLGATKLRAGEYAVFVWFDNVTAQTRVASNSGVPATRCAAEVSELTGGVPETGTLAWNSARFIGSLGVERNL